VRRREFLGCALGVLAARSACAQGAKPKLGVLSPGFASPETESGRGLAVFLRALSEAGYAADSKIEIEHRFAEDRLEQLPTLAAELVSARPSVIYAWTTAAAVAVAGATKTIPVIIGPAGEPVMAELAGDFSRPRANVTGLVLSSTEQAAKCLEILKETAPRVSQVGVLVNPDNPSWRDYHQVLAPFVTQLGLTLIRVDTRGAADIEETLELLEQRKVDGLLVPDDASLTHELFRKRLIEFASARRLPSASTRAGFASDGGLISLGTNIDALRARAAWYVARVLEGVPPRDLPVERPTRFHLALNMRVARAMGIDPPLSIQARADEVIE
jgi:putative tryptophan/tyrosine transport system substrate-binding protein